MGRAGAWGAPQDRSGAHGCSVGSWFLPGWVVKLPESTSVRANVSINVWLFTRYSTDRDDRDDRDDKREQR